MFINITSNNISFNIHSCYSVENSQDCCEVTTISTILWELQHCARQSVFNTNTTHSPVSLINLPIVCFRLCQCNNQNLCSKPTCIIHLSSQQNLLIFIINLHVTFGSLWQCTLQRQEFKCCYLAISKVYLATTKLAVKGYN